MPLGRTNFVAIGLDQHDDRGLARYDLHDWLEIQATGLDVLRYDQVASLQCFNWPHATGSLHQAAGHQAIRLSG